MTSAAETAFREGHLDDALAALKSDLRQKPQDQAARVFLFQLMVVLGQWVRASKQLDVLVEMDAQYALMAQTYRPLIAAELFRADLFKGQKSPASFGEPLPWFGALIEAARLTALGEHQAAGDLRGQAFEQAEVTPGNMDGEVFAWIADADSRFGPVIEAIVQGRYFWIPFSRIQSIEFEQVTDLRDLVWLPAHFVWSNGGEAVGFVPTRYPDSAADGDPEIRLARTTNWEQGGEAAALGNGQRMLATNHNDVGLLSIRKIELDQTVGALSDG